MVPSSIAAGLAAGFLFGLAAGIVWLMVWLVFGLGWLGFGLMGGLMSGHMDRLIPRRRSPTWLEQPPGYANLTLSNRKRKLAGKLVRGLAGGLATGLEIGLITALIFMPASTELAMFVFWLVTGFTVGLASGLAGGLINWAESPTAADQASTPVSTWQADRTLTLLRLLVFGLIVGLLTGITAGLVFGLAGGLADGLSAGIAFGLAGGIAFGKHHAWWCHLLAVVRLDRQGLLPRDLMGFLDDMHRLGLLRTVGPVYQFRHAEFQDHLAAVAEHR